MNLPALNSILWTIFFCLAACSSPVKDRPAGNATLSDSSLIANQATNASTTDSATFDKTDLTKIYTQAIATYIRAVYKKDKTVFDTLFFGKHVNGQPDDFPDIELPEKIEKTRILVVNPEIGAQLQQERKARVYINMMGWVDDEKADFLLVTFSNGFEHKFDCYIGYVYNHVQQEFKFEKARIETVMRNKEGRVDHFAIYEDGKYVGDKPIQGNNK